MKHRTTRSTDAVKLAVGIAIMFGSCRAQTVDEPPATKPDGGTAAPASDIPYDGKLYPVVVDSFAKNTRDQYVTSGSVVWTPGTVTFANNATLQRDIEAGLNSQITLEVDGREDDQPSDESEFRLWLHMDGATPCFVQFQSHRRNETASISLHRVNDSEDTKSAEILRTVDLTQLPNGIITVIYNFGMVTVKLGDSPVLTSHIDHDPLAIQAVRLQATDSGLTLKSLTVSATKAPQNLYSDIQLKALEEALVLHRKVKQATEERDYQTAQALADKGLQIRRSILGEEHPLFAVSLGDRAGIHIVQGEYRTALPLCLQVTQILQNTLGPDHPEFGSGLSNLALVYDYLNDYQKAQPLYRQALDIQRKTLGEMNAEYATTLSNLGAVYFTLADYDQATAMFVRATEILREVLGESHLDYASSLNNLAQIYQALSDHKKAEACFLETLEIRRRKLGEEHSDFAGSLNNLGGLYFAMGEYRKAEPYFRKATEVIGRTLGEQHLNYASSLNNLGQVCQVLGDYANAESCQLKSLKILRKVLGERDPNYANGVNNLAVLYKTTGRYSEAEPLFLEALQILKGLVGEKHPAFANALANAATLYHSMGEFSRAQTMYERAIEVQEEVLGENNRSIAGNLSSLAQLYQKTGRIRDAEPLAQRAVEIMARTVGSEHPDYAVVLSTLAQLFEATGDVTKAEPLYRQAAEIFRKSLGEGHALSASSLSNLAALYISVGEYSKAEPLLQQAVKTQEVALGQHHPDFATSLNNLGALYRSTGKYSAAESLYRRAMELQSVAVGKEHPNYAIALNNLSTLYFSQGEFEKAEKVAIEVLEIRRAALDKWHPDLALSLYNLASLHNVMGYAPEGEAPLREALAAFTRIRSEIIPTLSEAEARSFIVAEQHASEQLLSVLRRRDPADARSAYQCVWDKKRSVSRLRVGSSLSSDTSPDAIRVYGRLRDARLKLASLVKFTPAPEQTKLWREQLQAANDLKESLEEELAAANPASKLRQRIRDASIKDLTGCIPDGVAIIDISRQYDYQITKRQVTQTLPNGKTTTRESSDLQPRLVYDAFIIRGGQSENGLIDWIQLGDAKPIEDAAYRWRESILSQQPAADTDPALQLRQLLWNRLDEYLDECHTVIVLPDSTLTRIPWSALPGRKEGTYLIEDFAIGVADYGQQVYGLLTTPANSTESGLLVAGGINYGTPLEEASQGTPADAEPDEGGRPQAWPYLPGAESEARAIAEIWGQDAPCQLLSGQEATEESISTSLPGARYAHLATHGFFDTRSDFYGTNLRALSLFDSQVGGRRSSLAARNPLLMTGIVCSGANEHSVSGGDGILTAEEIRGLDLRGTDLVTLSACESALGDVAAGQGVFGLQRALHSAGVRTTVASLWKVDDEATRILMTEFYQNVWVRKMGRLEALRQAQLAMLYNYDAEAGQLRGLGGERVRIDPKKGLPAGRNKTRLNIRLWAAFQLSGDWR